MVRGANDNNIFVTANACKCAMTSCSAWNKHVAPLLAPGSVWIRPKNWRFPKGHKMRRKTGFLDVQIVQTALRGAHSRIADLALTKLTHWRLLMVGPRPWTLQVWRSKAPPPEISLPVQSTNRTPWHIIHEATHGDRWGSTNNPLWGRATEGSQPPVNFRAPEPSDFFGCIRCPNAPLTMAPRYETVPGQGWPDCQAMIGCNVKTMKKCP